MKTTIQKQIRKAITAGLLLSMGFLMNPAFGQSPQAMKYQGVARDNVGNELSFQSLGLRLSIVVGSPSGSSVYTETQNPTTNEFGLFNVQVGGGTLVSGNFSTIDWGSNAHYLKVEMDETGGTNYQLMGASELLSVPYALYAETTGDTLGTSPWLQNVDTLYYNVGNVGIGTSSPVSPLTVQTSTENEGIKLTDGSGAEKVHLAYNTGIGGYVQVRDLGNQITVLFRGSGGSYINSGNVGIGTTSPGAMLDVAGDIKIADGTQGTGKVLTSDAAGLASWQTPSASTDADSTNELQSLSIIGNDISISKGNTVTIPSSGSLWTQNADTIYYTGGNVGIGTTSPGTPLEVLKDSASVHQDIITMKGTFADNQDYVRSIVWKDEFDQRVAGIGSVWDGTSNNILFHSQYYGGENTETDVTMIVKGDGMVGIGTASPGAKLDLAGDIKITDGTEGIGKVLTSDATGFASWQTPAATVPSDTSLYADSSGFADTADNAWTSDWASYADTATYAYEAETADTATYAWEAESADTADFAWEAGYADTADFAWNAVWDQNGDSISYILGNVGVGTASPIAPFHAATNSSTYPLAVLENTGAFGSTLRFKVNGSNRWTLISMNSNDLSLYRDATGGNLVIPYGNVGIGTNNPNSKLSVSGGATFGSTYTDSIMTDGNVAISGNIGIGTTDPQGNLEIADDGGTASLYLTNYYNGSSGSRVVGRRANGTAALPTAVQTDNILASFGGYGYGTTGWGYSSRSSMYINAAQNWTDSTRGSYIYFTTVPIDSTSNIERLRITDAGNVGIGTTNPDKLLTLSSAESKIRAYTIADNQKSSVSFMRARAGTTAVNYTDQLGNIVAQGFDGTAYQKAASIQFRVDSTPGINDMPGNIEFLTTPNGLVTPVNRMIINSAGNVGIGTSDPLRSLHVYTSTNFGGIMVEGGTDFGGVNGLMIRNDVGYQYNIGVGGSTSATQENKFVFRDNTANVTRLVIDSIGNIGIGTTAPAKTLHVIGGTFIDNSGSAHAAPGGVGLVVDGAGGQDIVQFRDNGANTKMVITNLGNVGIGCPNPIYKLQVLGDIAAQGGVLRATSATVSTTITACSDIRYKRNVYTLSSSLDNVLAMRGVNYYWKKDEFPDKYFTDEQQLGFIAQELELIYPEVVNTDEDGYKAVDYGRLTPVLVEAIKEQQAIINAQRSELDLLKEEVAEIKAMVGERASTK